METWQQRWPWLLGAVLLTAVLGSALGALLRPRPVGPARPAIAMADAQRLRAGMTRAEVAAILGAPYNSAMTRPILDAHLGGYDRPVFDRAVSRKNWVGREVIIMVCFDADERVIRFSSVPRPLRREPSFWERVRRIFN